MLQSLEQTSPTSPPSAAPNTASAWARWAPGCALLLLLVGLPASVWRAEHRVSRLLQRALSEVSGEPVVFDALLFSSKPALILSGVRLGSKLHVARIEIGLDLRELTRPRIATITLVRPTLHLTAHDTHELLVRLRRRATNAPARAAPREVSSDLAGRRRPSGIEMLSVIDGRTVIEMSHDGHRYSLDARGIYFGRSAASPQALRRLVLGPTRVTCDGFGIAQLAASSVELDGSLRPLRAALLGGRLIAPAALVGARAGAALTLQTVHARRVAGGFRVQLKARPAQRDAGHLWLTVDIADDGARRARLRLAKLRLASYEPLLARVGWLARDARVDGNVSIERGAAGTWTLRGELDGRRVMVRHPWIAAGVIGPFDASVEARASLDASGELAVHRLHLQSGALELRLVGRAVASASGVKLRLRGELPQLPCQRMLADLPRGFAPHLDGMALEGNIGARLALQIDSGALDRTVVDFALLPRGQRSCKVRVDPPAADVNTLRRPLNIAVGGAHGLGQQLHLGPASVSYRRFDRIPKHVRAAFVVAEDAGFFKHHGFDAKQLANAFVANLRAGRPVRGASTISQQLVKNVFLHHARTLSRKFEEMVLTWRMEQALSKRRILELYLNMVEMGPGTYGVQAAARRYFGRDADELTPLQSAHLAALTPAPRPLARRFARADPDARWMGKLRSLLHLMRRSGSISRREQRRYAKRRLVLVRR